VPLPGRPAEPVLPFPPGIPPAARWAAAMRQRAESVHPRAGSTRRDALVNGVPPAARWAAGIRPRAGRVHPHVGAGPAAT